MPFQPLTKQQQEQTDNKPINISGVGGAGGASFKDVVPGQEKSQKSSGQYANLQQYIQANQPQGQAMGQKVAEGVEKAGQEAAQKVEQFGQQKPNVSAFDPNAYIQRAPELSQEEKTTYQTTKKTGGYTGPDSLEKVQGYGETQKSAQAATEKAKMAGTESGQQELLRQTYARPNYTQGETKLDQVLLGGNQQAKKSLSDLSSQYSDLANVFGKKAEDVGAGINQANEQALKNKQNILQAENKAWTDLLNPLEQRAVQANIERPQIQQRVYEDVGDDLLLEDTLKRLGLQEGQALYDLDLSSYLTPNMTELGINDVANQQERQKYAALASLFEDPTRTQIGEQGKNLEPIGFNRQKFDTDAQARAAEFQDKYKTQMTYLPGQISSQGFTYEQMENEVIPMLQYRLNSRLQMYGNDREAQRLEGVLNAAIADVNNFKNQFRPTRVIGRQT